MPPLQPPLVQVPPLFGHVAAAAMQVPLPWSQQPPESHASPAQHGWPGPPHAAQVSLLQTMPPPEHERFAQHG
jgi:hypothetical protein